MSTASNTLAGWRFSLRVALTALALGATVFVSACSGSDEPTATTAASNNPTATTAASGNPTATGSASNPTATAASTNKPTATSAPSTPAGPHGTLVYGATGQQLDPPHFVPYLGATSSTNGFLEPLVWRKTAPIPEVGPIDTAGSIASSWVVASDLSSITFKIRQDVPFNCGNCNDGTDWGHVTAQDVAWSWNNAAEDGNTNPRVGFVGAYLGPWEALDDTTVVAHVKPPLSGRWDVEISNQWRQSVAITSKKAYDTLGQDKADVTFIGTGPLVVKKWDEASEIVSEALPHHYRETSKVQNFIIRYIPETATLVAAFKTNEIQIANFAAAFVDDVTSSVPGTRPYFLGVGQTTFVSFGGNYWAQKDFEGNQIFPRDGFKPGPERPWIGDPSDPDQMAKALKVRQALAMSIDRDGISKSIGKGLNPPGYTYVGFRPDSPQWEESWFIPYDLAKAKQLLTEAGYPNGFKTTLWGPSDSEWGDPVEVIAAGWSQIGVDIEIQKTTYNAKRDQFITRNIPELFLHRDAAGDFSDPRGRLVSPQAGGANRGIELPNDVLEKYYLDSLTSFDDETRVANNAKIEDYIAENRLLAPFIIVVPAFLARPEVLSWQPFTENFGAFNAPWTAEMK